MYRITKEEATIIKLYLEERLESAEIASDNASDMLHGWGDPDEMKKWGIICVEYTKCIKVLKHLIDEIKSNTFEWIKK